MIKRAVLVVTLAAGVGATLPQRSDANYDCMTGRITGVTGNSITVYDKESRTFTVDRDTRFTSWPTHGRWQAIARLNTRDHYCDRAARRTWTSYTGQSDRLLDVGRLVAVHPRHDGTDVARWVQVAIDAPLIDVGYDPSDCLRGQ
jgi:hypothetical protein